MRQRMDKSLYDLLAEELPRRLPLHMPGHKRSSLLAPYLKELRADLDVTEIEGFDNLHEPGGILLDGMRRAAALWGACRSFYLVNGSTGGILAGLRALSRAGDTVIMQRECHLSVHQGVGLLNLWPVYLYPDMVEEYSISASLSAKMLERCLTEHPHARLLVLSCPSYEGVLSDLESLVSLAHQRGLKVLVDAAHGAHLGLGTFFPGGAVKSGADIVIQSLHKTLPSLTQTAIAHAGSEEAASPLEEQLDLFQTSSPSYLLMASIDGCVRLLEEKGSELFQAWQERLGRFCREAQGLKRFTVFGLGGLPGGVFGHDPSKILIGCARSGISGYRLLHTLREGYGIDLEMAGHRSALAMTGMGDAEDALSRLAQALKDIEVQIAPGELPPDDASPRAEEVLSPGEALAMARELISIDKASGRVCAEYVTAYPPGIPLLVPGERITGEIIGAIHRAGSLMKSRSKGKGGQIEVLKAVSEL